MSSPEHHPHPAEFAEESRNRFERGVKFLLLVHPKDHELEPILDLYEGQIRAHRPTHVLESALEEFGDRHHGENWADCIDTFDWINQPSPYLIKATVIRTVLAFSGRREHRLWTHKEYEEDLEAFKRCYDDADAHHHHDRDVKLYNFWFDVLFKCKSWTKLEPIVQEAKLKSERACGLVRICWWLYEHERVDPESVENFSIWFQDLVNSCGSSCEDIEYEIKRWCHNKHPGMWQEACTANHLTPGHDRTAEDLSEYLPRTRTEPFHPSHFFRQLK